MANAEWRCKLNNHVPQALQETLRMQVPRLIPATLLSVLVTSCGLDASLEPGSKVQPQIQILSSDEDAARAPARLLDIAGEWDIVEFDGFKPPRLNNDGHRHFFVDISAEGMRFAIGCNYSGMKGALDGGDILLPPDVDDAMQTEMGCGKEREERDEAFFRFFRSRPQVMLLANGRLRIVNQDHWLLLERADVRRLAYGPTLPEITGNWRVVGFTRFENGGYRGWGAMYAPGRIQIEGSTISYTRCPEGTVRFRYTATFTLLGDSSPESAPPGTCRTSPAATEVELMLAALLRQSPHAEKVPGGQYILRSQHYAVVLTSEDTYQRMFGAEAAEWERQPG